MTSCRLDRVQPCRILPVLSHSQPLGLLLAELTGTFSRALALSPLFVGHARHHRSFFNRIFVGLYKLASDPDPSVKNGAEMLDRLIKDIVNEESTALDLETFIPMLQVPPPPPPPPPPPSPSPRFPSLSLI